jgi:hypothetical protein
VALLLRRNTEPLCCAAFVLLRTQLCALEKVHQIVNPAAYHPPQPRSAEPEQSRICVRMVVVATVTRYCVMHPCSLHRRDDWAHPMATLFWSCDVWNEASLLDLAQRLEPGDALHVLSWDCDNGGGGRTEEFELGLWVGAVVSSAAPPKQPRASVRFRGVSEVTLFPEPRLAYYLVTHVAVKRCGARRFESLLPIEPPTPILIPACSVRRSWAVVGKEVCNCRRHALHFCVLSTCPRMTLEGVHGKLAGWSIAQAPAKAYRTALCYVTALGSNGIVDVQFLAFAEAPTEFIDGEWRHRDVVDLDCSTVRPFAASVSADSEAQPTWIAMTRYMAKFRARPQPICSDSVDHRVALCGDLVVVDLGGGMERTAAVRAIVRCAVPRPLSGKITAPRGAFVARIVAIYNRNLRSLCRCRSAPLRRSCTSRTWKTRQSGSSPSRTAPWTGSGAARRYCR